MTTNQKITFVGAGNMASCIIGGLIKQGVSAANITATDPSEEKRKQLSDRFGVRMLQENSVAVAGADVVLLCVKPQVLREVCQSFRSSLSHGPLVISIAAGVDLASLEQWLGSELPIVRCMPNTPAQVLSGASGLIANAQVLPVQRQLATELFSAIGIVQWVENEVLMHAVTALSGSGPAYLFYVMEAMEAAGVKQGLEAGTARQLAAQTVLGAARMVLEGDLEPGQLKRNVMSPGGTTERGIQVLEEDKLADSFDRAIDAAARRSVELSKQMAD